jgi:hypothetical protein
VLISSVVIGAAGVAATYVYNNHELEIKHEEKEAEENRLQAQAEISRQIETNRRLEALFKCISSDKDNEREFGYAMFQALGQEALAVKIIALRKDAAGAAVAQSATASTDPGVAKQAELISAQLSLRFWLFDPVSLCYLIQYPYMAKAGCPTVAGRRRTRAAPAGMTPAVS